MTWVRLVLIVHLKVWERYWIGNEIDGGRKEGDALGGENCTSAGVSLSIPVFKPLGMRGQVFYNVGSIWNGNIRSTSKKKGICYLNNRFKESSWKSLSKLWCWIYDSFWKCR